MSQILKHAEKQVKYLFDEYLSPDFTFHNLTHTQEVVDAVTNIAFGSEISGEKLELLQVAAWFHDTGYISRYQGHEEESASLAGNFLKKMELPLTYIRTVEKLILATRFPQKPVDPLESVICDADLFHLSKTDYPDYEKKLREEWKNCLETEYTDREWLSLNYELLDSHHYFTLYGIVNLQPGQDHHTAMLAKKLHRNQ